MFPPPRTRTIADDVDPGGLHVFVPGIMGAGVLMSLGILVSDLLRRLHGSTGQRREVQLTAWYLTRDVARSVHREQRMDPRVGLRSRRTYGLLAVVFLGLGAYGLVGSFWNYVNPVDQGWVEDIAWVFAVSALAAGGLLTTGAVLASIAWQHPAVPPWIRRVLARTPLGVTAPTTAATPEDPPATRGAGTPGSGAPPSATTPGAPPRGGSPPR